MTPAEHLISISRRYPHAWRQADEMRADCGHGLPSWEPWCFLPMAGWYAIVSAAHSVDRLTTPETITDVAILATLGAWRPAQGIYQFTPELYEAMITTSLEEELPADVLLRLPEWCVYIETPSMVIGSTEIYGFWAHLEHDANNCETELRLLYNTEGGLCVFLLHIGKWNIVEALLRTCAQFSNEWKAPIVQERHFFESSVNLILYLCSTGQDVVREGGIHGTTPSLASPTKTKKGWRIFPPDKPTVWRVGETISRQIRAAYQCSNAGGEHAGTRPHIRRAHWHGYWSGTIKPREGVEPTPRKFELKWLPPVPVAMLDDEL